MTFYYFTKDGEYGRNTNEAWEAMSGKDGLMAIPTWSWTDPMWDTVHSVAGLERYELANHYSIGIHDWDGRDEYATCQVCHLHPEDVGVRFLSIFEKQQLLEEEYYNA